MTEITDLKAAVEKLTRAITMGGGSIASGSGGGAGSALGGVASATSFTPLGIAAKALGGAFDLLTTSAGKLYQVFSDTANAQNKLLGSGVKLSSSFGELWRQAGRANMSLSEFTEAMSKSSKAIAIMGTGTFAKSMEGMLDSANALGMAFDEITDQFAQFNEAGRLSGTMSRLQNKDQSEAFKSFMKTANAFGSIMGMGRGKVTGEVNELMKSNSAGALFAGLKDAMIPMAQQNFRTVTSAFAGVFEDPAAGKQLVDSMIGVYNSPEVTSMMGGEFVDTMGAFRKKMLSGKEMKPEEAAQDMYEMSKKVDMERLRQLHTMAAMGDQNAAIAAKSMTDLLNFRKSYESGDVKKRIQEQQEVQKWASMMNTLSTIGRRLAGVFMDALGIIGEGDGFNKQLTDLGETLTSTVEALGKGFRALLDAFGKDPNKNLGKLFGDAFDLIVQKVEPILGPLFQRLLNALINGAREAANAAGSPWSWLFGGKSKETKAEENKFTHDTGAGTGDEFAALRNAAANRTPGQAPPAGAPTPISPSGQTATITHSQRSQSQGTPRKNISKDEKELAKKQVYDTLVAQGIDPKIALGMAGNFAHESGMDTGAVGDKNLKNNAFGIGQWRGDRFENLKKFAEGQGTHWNDLTTQAKFAAHELTQGNEKGAYGKIKAAAGSGDINAITQAIAKWYERPATGADGRPHGQENRDKETASLIAYLEKIARNTSKTAKNTKGIDDLGPYVGNA